MSRVEPRRWTLYGEARRGNGVAAVVFRSQGFLGPLMGRGETVEVVEAAPVEAELEQLRAEVVEVDRLLSASKQRIADQRFEAQLEIKRLRDVLVGIRFAYDSGSNELPDVDAAIEAQVREALEASE